MKTLTQGQIIEQIAKVVATHFERVPHAQLSIRVDDVETTNHHPEKTAYDHRGYAVMQWKHFAPGQKLTITIAPPEDLISEVQGKLRDAQAAVGGLVWADDSMQDEAEDESDPPTKNNE